MGIDVPVNEKGIRIGEFHHRSTISDADVDMMRDLHEINGRSYGQLARKYKLPVHTVAKICRYERRNQFPYRWKRVNECQDQKKKSGSL